ncbi:hypothetical protein HY605_05305 [Candidatus Peregrinibacteria bacterium]|nr:hypothetical protein [Candidatus Peregrinibacteria bacterium]
MRYFDKINLFKEKRFTHRGGGGSGDQPWINLDFLGDAAGGVGEGFKGLGKALNAIGRTINHLGSGIGWLVQKGPLGIFYLLSKGKDLGRDTYEGLAKGAAPLESLPEYHGLALPDMTNGESQEAYSKRTRPVWLKRRNTLMKEKMGIKKRIFTADSEYNLIDQRINMLNEMKTLQIVCRDQARDQITSIGQRRELGDFPEGSPMSDELNAQEIDLNKCINVAEEEIDLTNQSWFEFDYTGNTGQPIFEGDKPRKKEGVDLLKRRDELERFLAKPKAQIAFYEGQIEAINKHYDPEGIKEKRGADEKTKYEEMEKKLLSGADTSDYDKDGGSGGGGGKGPAPVF